MSPTQPTAKFVKKAPQEYFYSTVSNHYDLTKEDNITGRPLDGGGIFVRSDGALLVKGGSIDFDIKENNPERPGTIADFKEFAEGTVIEIG